MSTSAAPQNVTLTIDGVAVSVPKGTLLVEAAKELRREIPVYCYHPKMGPAGLCRICLVEIEGMPKLQIACNTPVAEGMVVHTQSAKAADGRRAVLELYLVNHPLDCPICDKGGECDLQDYAMAYGQGASRSADPKSTKPKAVDLGPTIVLDEERCVICQRCVRFDDLIVGDPQLVLKDRGHKNIIATATQEPYRHEFTGNVTELCPVGALTSKTYRFKSRPWDLKRTQTSCTQCSVGCRLFADTRVGALQRTMSVESDDAITDSWLCDRGRYNIGYLRDERRITQPLYKRGGEFVQISWEEALTLWAQALREASSDPAGIAVLGGGRLTNEEAYLLQDVFRKLGTRNLDWRAGRQRQAHPGREGGTLAQLEQAEAIVEIGESPAQRAPVMDLRIRKAVLRRGAKLVRVGSFERRPPSVACTDVGTVAEAIAALPANATRIALVWDGVESAQAHELFAAISSRASVRSYITGDQANARGAETMGMHPAFGAGYRPVDPGLDFDGVVEAAREGRLRVLSIFGANPVLRHPDGVPVREALERTPFVVVSELFLTQTAELATLVLPAKAAFEKSGTIVNLAGDVLPLEAAAGLEAPEGALSDFEMLVGLAQRLGLELPTQEDLEAAVLEHLANAVPPFSFADPALARTAARGATPAAPLEEGALRVLVESRIFAGGGTIAHDERLAALEPLPSAALGADDARRLGLRTGDYVDLESAGVVVHDVLVEVRDGMPAGTLALIDGLPDAPANGWPAGSAVRIANVRPSEAAEAAR